MPLALSINQELSRSKPDRELETSRSRQACYIRFSYTLGRDPCGDYPDKDSIYLPCTQNC